VAHTAVTGNSAQAWRPDQFVFAATDVVPDSLILQHSAVRGQIEGDEPVLRVAYVVDDDAQFSAEGDEIPEGEPALNDAVVYTSKITQLIRLSSEQYRQAGTATELARSVARALTVKADNAFVAQAAPTSPATAPVAGLVNVDGVEKQTSVSTNIDKLVDLEAAVRSNGATPSAWILAPDTWAALRKMKQGGSGSNVSILGAGTDNADARLLSLPVVVNSQVPSKTGLLVDNAAVVSAAGQVRIDTSRDQFFTSDSVAIRATWRTGHAVPRPKRIGVFNLGS
jgi:HK97 family phage major capsid protein